MSGAAIGAAILAVCCPPLWLVAIGLAITVLVRSADGRDHGRLPAVIALVLCGIQLIGVVVWGIVVGLQDMDLSDAEGDGDSSEVADDGTVSLHDLEVGDCFDDPTLGDRNARVAPQEVPVVPCARQHDAEVFHVVQVTADEFPGTKAIDRQALKCLPAFKEYVGIPFADSRLHATTYHPTRSSWLLGDRQIVCVAHEPRLEPIEGSIQGTRH